MTEDVKQPETSRYQGHIGLGILYGFGALFLFRFAVVLLSWLLSQLHFPYAEIQSIQVSSGLFIGAVQLVYVIPLFVYLWRSGRPRTAKGLVIAATIVALLNASFWGVLYTSRPRWH